MSATLLPEIPDGTIAVEVAWGADVTDVTGSGWTWTDITADVRLDNQVSFTLGRSDEASASQPATMSLVLDNASGDYSLGGQSSNWPNVRRGTPVRVRVDPDDGGGAQVVFQGAAAGWVPGWDTDAGKLPTVALTAAGALRRISQGSDPLRSALYRYMTLVEPPLEYWPLEEEKTATQGTSLTAGSPATFVPILSSSLLYGKVEWGADTDNPATTRAVKVSAGGTVKCPVRSGLLGSYAAISWSMRYTGGSGAFLHIPTTVGTTLNATFYTDGSVELYEGTTLRLSWNLGDPIHWDNVWHHYLLELDGSGFWWIYVDGVFKDVAAASNLVPTGLEFTSVPNPGGTEDPISVAHPAVFGSAPSTSTLSAAAAAHVGELATTRITRLCGQEAVDVSIVGTTPSTMGPQTPISFLSLLRECEAVDQGVLYDGVGPGLRYVCRSDRENAATDLTINADQLVTPFGPVDDDQRTRNRVTANAAGSKATFEDATGPMGTDVIGVYDSSVSVNLDDASEAIHYAGWAVHLGTREGYRYPTLTLNMRSTPILAASVLAVAPSSRITLEDVGTVLAGMPAGDVDLLVEGVAMTLSPYGWSVTLKCSPFGPWVVGTVASESGDTDTDVIRLDTDGSTLSASASLGATSISVATGSHVTETFEDAELEFDISGTWTRTNATSESGSWSLRSGVIGNSATSDAVVVVPDGATTVRFDYRVSSESGFDFLRFLIGSTQQFQQSGDSGWISGVAGPYTVTPGGTITFRYSKDSSTVAGLDAAFIDNLRFDFVGPLWTTDSDDYPLLLDVGGVRVRATACSDSTSPQVMTVDALPVARASGTAVKVWDPPALAL